MNDLLKKYLDDHYTPATARAYGREIALYLERHPQAREYRYTRILDYIGECRNKYSHPQTVNRILASVKVYYDWLCHAASVGIIRPARSGCGITCTGMYSCRTCSSRKSWNCFCERKNRYADLLIRNQVVISLLIYQGLLLGELTGLRVADVKLEEGART